VDPEHRGPLAPSPLKGTESLSTESLMSDHSLNHSKVGEEETRSVGAASPMNESASAPHPTPSRPPTSPPPSITFNHRHGVHHRSHIGQKRHVGTFTHSSLRVSHGLPPSLAPFARIAGHRPSHLCMMPNSWRPEREKGRNGRNARNADIQGGQTDPLPRAPLAVARPSFCALGVRVALSIV